MTFVMQREITIRKTGDNRRVRFSIFFDENMQSEFWLFLRGFMRMKPCSIQSEIRDEFPDQDQFFTRSRITITLQLR